MRVTESPLTLLSEFGNENNTETEWKQQGAITLHELKTTLAEYYLFCHSEILKLK